MTHSTKDELLTLTEVAARLKIRDRRTVLRQLERSGVGVIKVGRFARVRASQVDRMLGELEWSLTTADARPISETTAKQSNQLVASLRDRPSRKPRRCVTRTSTRRGWTEALGDGLYRRHRLACRASTTMKAGVRCDCPFACHQPTASPGKTSLKTIPKARSAAEARRLKKRIQGADRPSPGDADGTIKFDTFFVDVFLEVARLDKTTKDSYRDIYERDIKPTFGHRRLVDISEESVDRWVRSLEAEARERRSRTGRRPTAKVLPQVIPFRSAMTHAVRWRRIKSNPFDHVGFSEIEPIEPGEVDACNPSKVLTSEQLHRLYAAVRLSKRPSKHDQIEALVRCGVEEGMRRSEVRGLRYSDFDFAAGKVHIQRQVVDPDGEVKWVKGKKSRRLPVSGRLLELIGELLEQELTRGGTPDSYVFAGRDGGPVSSDVVYKTLRRALVRAELVDETGRPLISFHGLRHTCASLLLDRGVAPIKVSRFLGHSSLQVTLTVYAHLLSEEALDGVNEVFDELNQQAPASREDSDVFHSDQV